MKSLFRKDGNGRIVDYRSVRCDCFVGLFEDDDVACLREREVTTLQEEAMTVGPRPHDFNDPFNLPRDQYSDCELHELVEIRAYMGYLQFRTRALVVQGGRVGLSEFGSWTFVREMTDEERVKA
jgi:hypothetical protein